MHYKKQRVIHIIFLVEIVLFVYGYCWGRQGMISLYRRKESNSQLLAELKHERAKLEVLDERIIAWNSDSFYKERYAREQLHMARVGETLYIGS
jgi:cell division protein FtsB